MHEEAMNYLPKILKYLKITNPILFGHSDGASIALIYAGNKNNVKSLILEAPHVFVEDISIKGINDAKKMWNNSNLRDNLENTIKILMVLLMVGTLGYLKSLENGILKNI